MDKLARDYAQALLDYLQNYISKLETARVISVDYDASIPTVTIEVGSTNMRRLKLAIMPSQ